MAQRSSSTSKRNSSSTASRKKPSSGSGRKPSNTNSRASRSAEPEREESIFHVLWSYSFGKALYLLLGIAVLIGLDFLISMNNYDKFFVTLGIELIAAMVIGWIVYLFVERRKLMQSEEPESDSDES